MVNGSNARVARHPTSLSNLADTKAEPAADDRFAAVLDLTGAKPDFRVAVRLRVVTPGDYEYRGRS